MSQGRAIPSAVAEWLPALLGLLVLYVPTYVDLAHGLWAGEGQMHGPIILCLAIWLLWKSRYAVHEAPVEPQAAGWVVLIFALAIYIIGRSQDILLFEVGSQILVLLGILLILRGWSAVRRVWFPLFFLVFMVPLPSSIVDALTMPMKLAVSYVAEQLLYNAGYPISRSGVTLHIGQYKLLVADACAGLHTLFTLEALGLLYLNVVQRSSFLRNIILASLTVPISFGANVIRVMVLTLITYHFGDAAGQGFLHGFAGMLLFITALLLIIGVDSMIMLGVKFYWSRHSLDLKPGI